MKNITHENFKVNSLIMALFIRSISVYCGYAVFSYFMRHVYHLKSNNIWPKCDQ